MLQPLVSAVSANPLASTIVLMALGYLATKVALLLLDFRRINKQIENMPTLPKYGVLHYILGTIEYVWYQLGNMRLEEVLEMILTIAPKVNPFSEHGLVRVKVGVFPVVICYTHETVEQLVSSTENITKAMFYRFFDKWLGLGLLTSTGEKWKRHRKLLTPAFHFKILESFVPVMNENCKVMLNRLDGYIDDEKSEMAQKGTDVRWLITDCTLDTICETAMGTRVGAQQKTDQVDYVQPINNVLRLFINRVLEPLHFFDFVYNFTNNGRAYHRNLEKIHKFVRRVIDDRRAEMEKIIEQNKLKVENISGDDVGMLTRKRYAFLDSLLLAHFQHPKEFTMKDIQDEVNTFMFEGHDTTSISLIFNTLLIASHPRVQEKVHEELDSVFQGEERPITQDDCRQLKYLDMCIKEGLRLYPSVGVIARMVTKEFKVKEFTFPEGCTVAISLRTLHRDPKVFPTPEKYIPERFEPDQPIHKLPYAYIPFMAGPRNCIGQKFAVLEMKIMLASMLRRYKLTALSHEDAIDVITPVLTKANSEVMIKFEKRKVFA